MKNEKKSDIFKINYYTNMFFRPLKVEYYSHKLFWKGSSPGEIEILDLNTKSIARISLSTNDIQAFVIDYPQRYGFPGMWLTKIIFLN